MTELASGQPMGILTTPKMRTAHRISKRCRIIVSSVEPNFQA